jgi:hypothetical protein
VVQPKNRSYRNGSIPFRAGRAAAVFVMPRGFSYPTRRKAHSAGVALVADGELVHLAVAKVLPQTAEGGLSPQSAFVFRAGGANPIAGIANFT